VQTATEHCALCQGQGGASGAQGETLMWTDSESLMHEGVAAGRTAFAAFLDEVGWRRADIHKTFCHQVGRAHQKLLFEALALDPRIDYTTFDFLGNTGSVALPMTAALGIEGGHLQPPEHVALLGIGSGINVIALAIDWRRSLIEE
jgi:acyl-CoA:acyl-CoA alkyltransferase